MNRITKTISDITYADFEDSIRMVKDFSSATGRPYKVIMIDGGIVFYKQPGATNGPRQIELQKLYDAYTNLHNFQLAYWGNYLPKNFSAGRSLLIHAGLLKHE